MSNNKRPGLQDQAAHEVAAGRGFLLWIAAYLVLTLTFLIADHPGEHRAIAGHRAGDFVRSAGVEAGSKTIAPSHRPVIARRS
jgi:hypothetical protein